MGAAAEVGVIAIRQAGSAAAFAPLVRHLRARRPDRALKVFCYPPARATWDREGLQHVPIASFADARPHLEVLSPPAFVLTGTSLEVGDDARWWEWAAARRVPSIAFVDQWVNYWQRFAAHPEDGPRFDRVPDRIAVVDDIAARRLVDLGCPSRHVVEAGSPAFDALFEIDRQKMLALRESYCERDHARLVVFACEPATPPQTGADFKRRFGFCEEDVVAMLGAAAADCAARLSRKIRVVFKLHPIQVAHGMRPTAASHDERYLTFSHFDGDRLQIVAAADVVVGMRSMLLYEAALIGRPVISVQPQRIESCDLTDSRAGIEVVGSEAALRRALYEALIEPQAAGEMPGTLRHAAHEYAQRFAERLELV